jgi:hypothetical protein
VVPEATLENGVPRGGGWFVVNARESRWLHNELGAYCGFEGRDEAAFDELGINLNVLPAARAWKPPQRRSLFASMSNHMANSVICSPAISSTATRTIVGVVISLPAIRSTTSRIPSASPATVISTPKT